jgi:ketosteroid isomerase-like protein
MRALHILTVAFATGLAACNRGESREEAEARYREEAAAAQQAIEAQVQRFVQHVNAGHADSVAMLYTENANLMPPGLPTVTGRAAIHAFFADTSGGGPFTLTLTPVEIIARGPIAIERGTYTAQIGPVTDAGKYLVHWHHVQGEWLMADDIWNSDQGGEM